MSKTYWSMSGDLLLEMLHEVAAGADPEMVYLEAYANADREGLDDEDY